MASNVIQHRPRRSGVSLTAAPHLASPEAADSSANSPDAELSPAATAAAANPVIALLHSAPAADSSPLVTLLNPQEERLPSGGALLDRRYSGGGAALLGRRPSAGGGAFLERRQSGSGGTHLAGALLAQLEPPALRQGHKTSAVSNAHGHLSSHILVAPPEIHQVCTQCCAQVFQLWCCLNLLYSFIYLYEYAHQNERFCCIWEL